MILAASPWMNTVPAIAAVLGYGLLAAGSGRWEKRTIDLLMAFIWLSHGLALVMGMARTPVHFGFAPALSFSAWLVFTVYGWESRHYPQLRASWKLALLGAAAVLLALGFPGSRYPPLISNWMPVHWALGIASYGLLAAAVVHAWMMQHAEVSIRQARQDYAPLPLLALERLTFHFVTAAFVLLSATLLAGWGFSQWLHPHGWTWSHKTLFTVLSWLVLAVLLWGRWRWGWRGRLAVRMLYASAAFLLLGYVGSRFVLEVVLQRA